MDRYEPIPASEPDTRQAPNLAGLLATADDARVAADKLHAEFGALVASHERECSYSRLSNAKQAMHAAAQRHGAAALIPDHEDGGWFVVFADDMLDLEERYGRAIVESCGEDA